MEARTRGAGEGSQGQGMPLSRLVDALDKPTAVGAAEEDPLIRSVTTRSDDVGPGALFIAIRGTRTDGHRFLAEAVERGASAVLVEADPPSRLGVPAVRVPDTRRASAEVAAAWHGHPARRMRMAGITGSIGKTSILAMLEAMLGEAGIRAGAVGSLGVHVDEEVREATSHTAPDPLRLHEELARLADEGCALTAMEVTSHALDQDRVHGIGFDLGVFTNLVPLEHSEYHPTFRDYANAKRRFFDHLKPCVPLVFHQDDPVVRRLVHDSDADPIPVGAGRAAVVRIEWQRVSIEGSRFVLRLRRPIPRMDGGAMEPLELPLSLRSLGHSNIDNAALAATAALSMGVGPGPIRAALERLPRQPRRLQVIHRGDFTIIDDTVGHPDSVSALFRVVRRLRPRRVHIAFAVRGQRGPRVNRQTALALGIWAGRLPTGTLSVTRSDEAADPRNRVEPDEMQAVERALAEAGVGYRTHDRLDQAVESTLAAADQGDVVLLLGAQGMDAGHRTAEQWLNGH